MIVLGVDTSGIAGGVALFRDSGLIGEYILNVRTTHSERLLPAIHSICSEAGVDLSDIDAFAVTTGPGSFTGLRIGVATVKGLAYALQKPVVGMTVFEAYVRQFHLWGGQLVPLVDARREEVYAQVFVDGQEVCSPWSGPLQKLLDSCNLGRTLFVGDGAQTYAPQLKNLFSEAVFPELEQIMLRPASVAGLGFDIMQQGRQQTAVELLPFYMRASSAERLKKGEQHEQIRGKGASNGSNHVHDS